MAGSGGARTLEQTLFFTVLLLSSCSFRRVCVCVCVCVCLFRAEPTAYEGFQARGRIEAVAASLHHSHSNSGSKLHMRPTPQLTATLDP